MKTRMLAAAILATALSGCIGSNSRPPSYYLLTASAQPAAMPATSSSTDTALGVGPVRVAPFLMRPQIATHDGGGNLALADDRRWSEPLEQGIQRVLLQNLAAQTGADTRSFPWTQATLPRHALRVDVIDLDRTADGQAHLDVKWILEEVATQKLLASRHEQLSAPIGTGADSYAALAAAYSELLAQLAARMAEQLADSMTSR